MNPYSYLPLDARDSNLSEARLKATTDELQRLYREITTEENTFRDYNKIEDHVGYKYYKSELDALDNRIKEKKDQVDSTHLKFKEKKENEIKKVQNEIEKKEAEIKRLQQEIDNINNQITTHAEINESKANNIDNKINNLRQQYIEKIQEIQTNIGKPTSLAYRRKKTRIDELEKLADEQREKHNLACLYDDHKKAIEGKRNAMIERQREEEKERIEKERALAAWERQQEAQREADRQNWLRKGLETDTAENFEPEPVFDLSTSEGRNAEKAYRRKLLKK